MKLFKKKKLCVQCGKKSKETVNFAGYDICSEQCMSDFFKCTSIERILELSAIDSKMRNGN